MGLNPLFWDSGCPGCGMQPHGKSRGFRNTLPCTCRGLTSLEQFLCASSEWRVVTSSFVLHKPTPANSEFPLMGQGRRAGSWCVTWQKPPPEPHLIPHTPKGDRTQPSVQWQPMERDLPREEDSNCPSCVESSGTLRKDPTEHTFMHICLYLHNQDAASSLQIFSSLHLVWRPRTTVMHLSPPLDQAPPGMHTQGRLLTPPPAQQDTAQAPLSFEVFIFIHFFCIKKEKA